MTSNSPRRIKERERYALNRDKQRKRSRAYYQGHKEERLEYHASRKESRNRYLRLRRKTSASFKLRELLSVRILMALNKRLKKASKTESLLGASVEFVRGYLEAKFLPGMSWKNHGTYGWHIDHIRPCSKFDLSDPKQQKLCFHYSNLQPLWAKDNLEKSDKTV